MVFFMLILSNLHIFIVILTMELLVLLSKKLSLSDRSKLEREYSVLVCISDNLSLVMDVKNKRRDEGS